MGLFDFLTKAQDKINELQKRINESQSKNTIKTTSPAKPDSTDQIIAQRDSFIRNGFAEYEFIANRDCCDVCRNLNGKHFPVRKLAIGVNAPPMHEGCRCSIAAYSNRKEYDEWLNSL